MGVGVGQVLSELGFTQEEFNDLCIMLGCDYAGTIKGVGQVKVPPDRCPLPPRHSRLCMVLSAWCCRRGVVGAVKDEDTLRAIAVVIVIAHRLSS